MATSALMTTPIQAGATLAPHRWREIRQRAIFEFCKWDVQCQDHSVLATFPLLLDASTARYLEAKAEALTREALAAEQEILERPELLQLLSLPRAIRRVLRAPKFKKGNTSDIRVMRFDFHFTDEGWRISEVNSDVPGGFIEASGWNVLFAENYPGMVAPANTSKRYVEAICAKVERGAVVALVHATCYSDDRQVMMHLARCLEARGARACLCSSEHLRWEEGRAVFAARFVSGRPDAIVRFFPAEWLPNLASERSWLGYFGNSVTPVSNPGTAIVLQTKRFPLVWDKLHTDHSTWREFLPETRDVSQWPPLTGYGSRYWGALEKASESTVLRPKQK